MWINLNIYYYLLKCQENTGLSHDFLTGITLSGGFSCFQPDNKAQIRYISNVDTECNICRTYTGFVCQRLSYEHKVFGLLKNWDKVDTGAKTERVDVKKKNILHFSGLICFKVLKLWGKWSPPLGKSKAWDDSQIRHIHITHTEVKYIQLE